jgi:hypothetical protein
MPTLSASFWQRYRAGFVLAAVATLIALAVLFVPATPGAPTAPARPAGVPREAVWAGGGDGGAWIACTQRNAESPDYACRVYHDTDGSVWAQGTYVLRRLHWDMQKEQPVYEPVPLPATLEYVSFDGEGIFLTEERVLIPHGTIDYPASGGHGKRQDYHEGTPRGERTPY